MRRERHRRGIHFDSGLAVQGLRLEKDEAERLNITAAPLPDEGYATMFGVYHNLHCIVNMALIPHLEQHLTGLLAPHPPAPLRRLLLS